MLKTCPLCTTAYICEDEDICVTCANIEVGKEKNDIEIDIEVLELYLK